MQSYRQKVTTELEKTAPISIIRLIDALIEHAYRARASDIHIDPSPSKVRVRFRIDGVLQDTYTFPKNISGEVVSRIKVLAGLRTDEHQTAQDGRFRNKISDENTVDVRVSVVPTYHGENAVLRLLGDKAEAYTLESLGFTAEDQEKILRAVKKSHGMILSTGPTGSGKTTTLYTLIRYLNTSDVSIVTLEDPIEYAIDGIEQIQVNARTGLTFANGLRSILRQDPNVIMVGEIRDAETASIAVNTALTGHLLLSTLHTSDAATTLPRLLDMKIESFLIASTVNIAIGQRLVRKICPECKESKVLDENQKKSLTGLISDEALADNQTFSYGVGCEECVGTGYQGRIGVNEVLVVDNDIREAILRRASASEIKKIAVRNGMTTMREDGIKKALAGQTTIEEVLRVIHE